MTAPRTIGVEEELHVVDLATGRLTARAPELLRALPTDQFAAELQRSTVETNTRVCTTLEELSEDMLGLRSQAAEVAAAVGLGVIATGTAPLSREADFELTTLGRFNRMQQDYRFLVEDQLICGLQVHVGVPDRDLAVRVAQRVAPYLPTLLAMSTSSPYWHGEDTGYSSFRTMVWQRWPTAGSFGYAETAADYDRLVSDLIAAQVISDPAMAYFDVRPSAHVPTVELRVCDSCPTSDDAVLIAALFRALVDRAAAEDEAGAELTRQRDTIHRAAMWRAARNGLRGPLLTPDTVPQALPAAEVVNDLVRLLGEQLEASGDRDTVLALTASLLARGDASSRQRARFAERGRIGEVVSLAIDETRGDHPEVPPAPQLTVDYPAAPEDEALAQAGIPYPPYRPLFQILDGLADDELMAREASVKDLALADGLTFGVDGEQRAFAVDIVPRILAEHDWSALTAGLSQRARAIELFLEDIYGPAEIVREGVLDWDTVRASPGWDESARSLPHDVIRAPMIGFDLVRDVLGGWRVLEDNTRTPSGVGYALGIRRLMRDVLPELTGDVAIRDPATTLDLIGRTLRAAARRPDPVVALLSDGANNSAWYEHQMIAHGAGLVLAEPGDVTVDEDAVLVRGVRVDVLYLRLEVELADLPVGAEILRVAQAGGVVLANAPGAGVADDKALYCLVPEFISYYLSERPLLSPVPTYRCSHPGERAQVLDRLAQLVTKPVDGYGGSGVLIGPSASEQELTQRRHEIELAPAQWIGQEVVPMSTHPTLAGLAVEPRHIDLRAFVYLRGTGADEVELGDLALTRVAPAGSMVVNSSRGGGAKDTWIMTGSSDDEGG